ncbi:putative apyrase 2 [Astathelohania contejeani]|uniref:Apyrase 2 n=1 Tax=Astathelohania contejeani TaxID=164912 RepID=A0ABQ7I0Z6_9MICR|nr:putative apyrase 2 [Thelohania contejeani]
MLNIFLTILCYILEVRSYYAAVIDCGSTGTRLNIFHINNNRDKIVSSCSSAIDFPITKESTEYEIEKLFYTLFWDCSSYISNAHVEITQIPISVMATGGIRILGIPTSLRIFKLIYRIIRKFGFRKKEIGMLDDKNEGFFALKALKFLKGSNGNEKRLGIVEMGGASLQIAYDIYLHDLVHDNDIIYSPFDSNNFIYTKSFLGMGIVEAMKVKDLNKIFSESPMPVPKVDELYLLSFFYNILKNIEIPSRITFRALKEYIFIYCKSFKKSNCDELLYIITVLEWLNISDSQVLVIKDSINNHRISWTLGKALSMKYFN